MNKVLVLNQFALPRDQGGGTRHIDLFSRVDGWEPVIVAGDRNHYSQDRFTTPTTEFRLVRVPRQDGGAKQRLVSWLAYCSQAAAIGLRERPSVIYASSPHLLAPLTGWLIARALRRPYVLEVRDLWPESFVAAGLLRDGSRVHRALKVLERFVVRRADSIVVVTSGWEDHFRSLGANMDNYFVVPNGTEPYDLRLTDEDRQALRRELGIAGATAIFAGAHGPKDGIDLILDAAAQTPTVNFLLVGSGPFKAAAMARAKAEGLTNVEFREPVAKDSLPQLLAACDIGIHAVSPLPVFRLGMSPNKLFDYLAAGLPVVSNAGESVAGLVGRDRVGHVGGSADIAVGLRHVLDADDSQRRAWADHGRSLVTERFSRQAAAKKLSAVLGAAKGDSLNVQELPA